MLLTAQSSDARRGREVSLRMLQLMTGDLLSSPVALH